jgi:imidazolonepropionase-like amidohydrolase
MKASMKPHLARLALLAAAVATTPAAALDTVLIRGATVHTMGEAGVLESADVLLRGRRIAEVGRGLAVPEGAAVFEAQGRIVTPGLFDAHSYLGLVEIGAEIPTVDNAAPSPMFSAALDMADAVNPRSTLIPVNRVEGLTRAMAAPGPADGGRLIHGLGAVIHLGGVEDYLTRPRAAMFASFGEAGAALAGGSRAAALLNLREALEEARGRLRQGRVPQLSHLDAAALQPLLAGQVPLVLSVHRASDILAALRLAKDYGLRLAIHGGAEAWLVADQLAAAQVPVIFDPTRNLPERFEALNLRLDAAARLHRAGVATAFTEHESHNARNLRQLAGIAVAHGLPHAAGLAAITRTPAEIYGLGSELGQVRAGYRGDLVIWDGDPLEVTSYPVQVFIEGRALSPRSRQTELRDRYLPRVQPSP